MSKEKDWIHRAAQHTFELVFDSTGGDKIIRAANAKGVNHALWLITEVSNEAIEGTQAHRWLAHAYCILIYEERISIEIAKNMNRMAAHGDLTYE